MADHSTATTATAATIEFDLELPSQHRYLGEVEELPWRFIYEHDEQTELYIFALAGVVLFPGATIPLRVGGPVMQGVIERVMATTKTVGVVNLSMAADRSLQASLIGCTAEIRSIRREDGVINVVATGRQRFRLCVSAKSAVQNLDRPKAVRILNDCQPRALPPAYDVANLRARQWPTIALTRVPLIAWHSCDASRLAITARNQLMVLMEAQSCAAAPHEAVAFSFWMCHNLPLETADRLRLLEAHSACERLRMAMRLMEQLSGLCCRRCGARIGHRRDVFSMIAEGPIGTFVNPAGCNFELLTLRRATGLVVLGQATSDFCWFAGYQWQIAICSTCGGHIGWYYTTRAAISKAPRTFWGFSRANIANSTTSDPPAPPSQHDDEDLPVVLFSEEEIDDSDEEQSQSD